MNNKLYYLVGVEGSGKTTVAHQLALSVEGGKAIKVSPRLNDFLEHQGIHSVRMLHARPDAERDQFVNQFHLGFSQDKQLYPYIFLDGHMLVTNKHTGKRMPAMASNNSGVTDGIIFLNTPSELIAELTEKDNQSNVRSRSAIMVKEIKALSEIEFTEAESYCIKHGLDFGVISNAGANCCSKPKAFADTVFLNQYHLPQSKELRALYNQQFDMCLTPSELRKLHCRIGKLLVDSFLNKTQMGDDYQVFSMDRSGNYIANGFIEDFNGHFYVYPKNQGSDLPIDDSKALLIIDSVIDSGATIQNVISHLPQNYHKPIHVLCLSINVKALDVLNTLEDRVMFHCLGFSNKEDRPRGKMDMGARLYGTT